MMCLRSRMVRLVFMAAMVVLGVPAIAAAACTGDCNGDGDVTVDEIVTMTNIALGEAAGSVCTAGDSNNDQMITVDEIVTALDGALNGCSPEVTPTPGAGTGRIVFLNTDFTTFMGDIWAIDEDGSDRRNLTNTAAMSEGQPSWSPDGNKIVFTSDGAIAIMNADGSGRTPVTGAGENLAYPSWSPDGSRIVFVSQQFQAIEVVDVDGSNRTPLLPAEGHEYQSPSFSPDGAFIAFVSDRATGMGGAGLEIFVMNADGSDVKRITDDDSEQSEAGWGPTNKIAFTSDNGISLMNPDGSNQTPLASGNFPGWSRDGGRLAYFTFEGVKVINANGSGAHVVPNTTSDDVDPDID